MRADKKTPLKTDKKAAPRSHKRGVVGYGKKTALLEDAITQMNAGKYGRSSAALKELLALDPHNMEARRLFATLHLRLGSLIPARQAFDSLINEAFERQDYWLAESLLREYLAVGPRCVPFLEKLGAVYQGKGDALEAVTEYGKAIDILIEDPDTDNPRHASQLYTKIRELAPASPVAFRLASFFDAQTGELVARSAVAHEEAPVATPVPPAGDEAPPALSIQEPIAGPMPWEQVEDSPGASGFSPVQESARPSESPVSPEGAGILPQEERSLADTSLSSDSPAVERSESSLDAQSEARGETPEAVHISEPVELPKAEKPFDLVPGALLHGDTSSFVPSLDASYGAAPDSIIKDGKEAPETFCESDSIHAIANEPVPPSTLSFQERDDPSPQIQQEVVAEVVSAPMPWEHVQESTISIPDHVLDVPPVPATQTEAVSTAPLLEPESSAVCQDESRDVAQSAPATPVSVETSQIETSQKVLVTVEPTAASSAPAPDQLPASPISDPMPEPLKGGGFSWESVFNSAWKFGDKLSVSASQPGVTQTDTIEIEEPPASTSSSLPTQVPEAESVEIQEANREPSPSESAAAISVAAPMPWDQVQESVITIPPAQFEEPVAGALVEQTVQSAHPVEPVFALRQEPVPEQSQLQPLISPTNGALETEAFSITQPPPAPPSSEPEFRLAGLASVFSVKEDQTTSVEAEHPTSASAEVSEPPKSVEPEPPSFTIAASVPTVEVVPTAPTHVGPALLGREESVEPVAIAPPSFSTSLSPSAVEVAPAETQPEAVSSSLKEEIIEPAPVPQTVVAAQPAPQVESTVAMPPLTVEVSIAPEPLADSAQVPSLPTGDFSHWNTGEVVVLTHRPSSKKRKRASEPVPEIPVASLSSEETSHRQAVQSEQQEAAFAEARARNPEPAPQQEEWIKTGESIRFIEEPKAPPVVEPEPQAPVQAETGLNQPVSTAAAAVDVLFESSGHYAQTGTREHVAGPKPRPKLRSKLNRIRIGISVFISSCFSTTRAIVTSLVVLAVVSGALVALGIGAVGLAWIIMEEPPSAAFQSLTTNPQRMLWDSKKNGYLLLLGFDAPAGQDPIQAGYERKPDAKDADMTLVCLGGPDGGAHVGQSSASASVASGWFRGSDPVGQFKSHQDTIKGWVSQRESALGRYKQWQKLSFEDWGYGRTASPPCTSIIFAHRLYLADGFVQGTDIGVDRLETDMEAWRIALGQAKTLPVKTLALQAINDDIAVASGLVVRPDFDGKYLGRMTKILRPFDQVELSIRWPMQSELVSATKAFEFQLKAEGGEEQALHTVVAAALPLPKQRRFNDYAEYYEASYKAAGEGRYGSLPKWKNYIHFPATTVMDYLTNPIENIVGLEPLPPWDLYNGLVVDTDARLRLASVQAWLRRGPQDADLLTRIAKAGRNFYDPYTGLPMLVNLKKRVMYSVGHDGKDQDADPQSDVVVTIPVNQAPAVPAKSFSESSK